LTILAILEEIIEIAIAITNPTIEGIETKNGSYCNSKDFADLLSEKMNERFRCQKKLF